MLQQLIQIARQQGIPVLVDPKSRDLNRYRGATLITPNKLNLKILSVLVRDEEELVAKAQRTDSTLMIWADYWLPAAKKA